MTYSIEIRKKAAKALSRIPEKYRENIITKIKALSTDPHPLGSKNLTSIDGWRIRIGDYRVIYEINDNKLTILVLHIGHRKDIYR